MKSALSVKVFGVYAILTGVTLTVAPNFLLSLFGFAETREIWVRVLGVMTIVLGYYYWASGAGNARPFIVASVPGRFFFCLGLVSLVVLGGAPWKLGLFGGADAAWAVWTLIVLRKEAKQA